MQWQQQIMASSLLQIAGPHSVVFESYYLQLDPSSSGQVGALKAATFLKKSNLSDAILSKVWDLSDPKGNGYLDKYGVYVALKLVSLAQIGVDVSLDNLNKQTPLPKLSENTRSMSVSDEWAISDGDRIKYDKLFHSLEPINDRLPGSKVKPLMINSKLPVDVLGKIWDLSDIDNDGFLDRDEFLVGMHLIHKTLANFPVPSSLPPSLLPSSKRKKSLPGSVPVMPILDQARASPTPSLGSISSSDSTHHMNDASAVTWVVSANVKTKYDAIFKSVDHDMDDFVTGADVKDIFLQSGLSQNVLADIWTLCDVNTNGRLNSEQFALAMYLMNRKIQGIDVPTTLTLEMTPPSLLPKPDSSGEDKAQQSEISKELLMISKEIEELQKEKMQLEQDIAQKEADITIRNGEVNSLQNMLNSLSSTLKQLEVQKGEAQKRLDDLDSQKLLLDKDISELENRVQKENLEVDKLKTQLTNQEDSMMVQESQLNNKRKELNNLKMEETKLEEQVQSGKSQLEGLNKTLQDTHLLITQTKSKLSQLQDTQSQITELLLQYDSAISSGDISAISELSLRTVTPTLSEQEYHQLTNTGGSSPIANVANFSLGAGGEPDKFGELKEDDPFMNRDPFTDEFKTTSNVITEDPFTSEDPFKDNVDSGNSFQEIDSKDDPFGGSDPFAGQFSNDTNTSAKPDSFDPFGLSNGNSTSNTVSDPFSGDPFGSPPVAPRAESPTPALPPKKSKAPPPRPAPPKGINKGPPRAAPPAPDPFLSNESKSTSDNFNDPFSSAFDSSDNFNTHNEDPFGSKNSNIKNNDPFASSGASHGGFADFSNFN